MAWTIEYTDTAKDELRKLDKPVARRIVDFMDERISNATDPRQIGHALTGPLGEFWRYRVGDWRIITHIEDEIERILVVRIAHRREVYRWKSTR